tara:strand:- start:975 stop:1433 length:459 start_codon:yes stop_codon:yes gene_type:complete
MKGYLENNTITKWPIDISYLKTKHKNTSFPSDWESANLSSFGMVTIKEVTRPTIDSKTQKLNELNPELIDGDWTQKFEVASLTTDEINNQKSIILADVRLTRDELLKESDWTQVTDSPLSNTKKTEWATYRQSLRDVPSQSDVYNITWPAKP